MCSPIIRQLAVAGVSPFEICWYNNYCRIIHFQYPCDDGEIPVLALSLSHLIGGRYIKCILPHSFVIKLTIFWTRFPGRNKGGVREGICKLNVACVANSGAQQHSVATEGSLYSQDVTCTCLHTKAHAPSPIMHPCYAGCAPGLTWFYYIKYPSIS